MISKHLRWGLQADAVAVVLKTQAAMLMLGSSSVGKGEEDMGNFFACNLNRPSN